MYQSTEIVRALFSDYVIGKPFLLHDSVPKYDFENDSELKYGSSSGKKTRLVGTVVIAKCMR